MNYKIKRDNKEVNLVLGQDNVGITPLLLSDSFISDRLLVERNVEAVTTDLIELVETKDENNNTTIEEKQDLKICSFKVENKFKISLYYSVVGKNLYMLSSYDNVDLDGLTISSLYCGTKPIILSNLYLSNIQDGLTANTKDLSKINMNTDNLDVSSIKLLTLDISDFINYTYNRNLKINYSTGIDVNRKGNVLEILKIPTSSLGLDNFPLRLFSFVPNSYYNLKVQHIYNKVVDYIYIPIV